MTKEEAIKLIDDRMCFGRGKWSEHHKPEIDIYWQAGEMAIKALEAEPHWIPVTERLPEIAKEKKTNAEKFSEVFGFTATELWAKPENEFLDWLNAEVTE